MDSIRYAHCAHRVDVDRRGEMPMKRQIDPNTLAKGCVALGVGLLGFYGAEVVGQLVNTVKEDTSNNPHKIADRIALGIALTPGLNVIATPFLLGYGGYRAYDEVKK